MGFTNYQQLWDTNGRTLEGGIPYLSDLVAVKSFNLTLNDPSNPATLQINDQSGMLRLYPSADIYYNATTAPAVQSGGSTTIRLVDFGTGGIAKANAWTVMWLQPGINRTVILKASSGSPTCWVEAF